MLARGRLAHLELARDQEPAHPVAHEIAVDLAGKMRARALQPMQDEEPAVVGNGLGGIENSHICNLPIP
jgi:hypothetical protein